MTTGDNNRAAGYDAPISKNTLLLLQNLLHSQQISVGASDEEISAVLFAKKELVKAIEHVVESAEPFDLLKDRTDS